MPLLEAPRRLLAEHAGRLAARVALDDAAVDLKVAVGSGERCRVEPQRVVVLGDQRGRRLAGDCVEVARGRVDAGRPVAAPPAVAPQPASLGARRVPHPGERLVERAAAVELDVGLRERPRRKVHVRVCEARHDDAPAEVDDLGGCERRLVHADAARDPPAGDRERPLGRHRRLHRPDHAVLEDHRRLNLAGKHPDHPAGGVRALARS